MANRLNKLPGGLAAAEAKVGAESALAVSHAFEFGRTALAFIFALGVIIFVHEAGHFLAARAFGMKVLAFSLGFGRKILGFTRGETEYKIGWIPLGGYVKLAAEDPGDQVSEYPREFVNRPRWQRIIVYFAGPAANAVLSVLLIAGVNRGPLDDPGLSITRGQARAQNEPAPQQQPPAQVQQDPQQPPPQQQPSKNKKPSFKDLLKKF